MEPTAPTPNAGDAQPPTEKRSGCLTALLILLGVAVVAGGVGAYFIYRLMSTPEARAMMSVVKSAVTAPGRKQLRAAGCDAVLVIDMHAMAQFEEKSKGLTAEDKERMIEEAKTPTITCSMKKAAGVPTCAQLAAVYVNAVHPERPFVMVVGVTGNEHPLCAEKYDTTGKDLGAAPFDQAGSSRALPTQRQPPNVPPPVAGGDPHAGGSGH